MDIFEVENGLVGLLIMNTDVLMEMIHNMFNLEYVVQILCLSKGTLKMLIIHEDFKWAVENIVYHFIPPRTPFQILVGKVPRMVIFKKRGHQTLLVEPAIELSAYSSNLWRCEFSITSCLEDSDSVGDYCFLCSVGICKAPWKARELFDCAGLGYDCWSCGFTSVGNFRQNGRCWGQKKRRHWRGHVDELYSEGEVWNKKLKREGQKKESRGWLNSYAKKAKKVYPTRIHRLALEVDLSGGGGAMETEMAPPISERKAEINPKAKIEGSQKAENRTVHFFLDGKVQKNYFRGIPCPLHFAFKAYLEGTVVTLEAVQRIPISTVSASRQGGEGEGEGEGILGSGPGSGDGMRGGVEKREEENKNKKLIKEGDEEKHRESGGYNGCVAIEWNDKYHAKLVPPEERRKKKEEKEGEGEGCSSEEGSEGEDDE